MTTPNNRAISSGTSGTTPTVSVIIPTYNRAHLVAGRSGLCSTRPTRISRSLWWTTAIGTVYHGGIGK